MKLFWSAEAVDDSELSDCTLACVVAPVWSGDAWHGLLGVANVWLPDLDDEQRTGLLTLARTVAGQLDAVVPVPGPAPEPATAPKWAPAPVEPITEPFLGEVLDNLPYGLVVTRADGAIVLVNQTFAAMTGLAMDDLLGEDVTEVFSVDRRWSGGGADPAGEGTPDDPAAWMAGMLGEAGSDRQRRVRLRLGDTLPVEAIGRRIRSRFAGDCIVTLVRAADGPSGPARPARDASIEDLLDDVEDGIVCCNADGVVVLANTAARIMQGLPLDLPMVGLPFPAMTALRTVEGEPLATEAHPLIRALHTGVPVAGRFVRGGASEQVVHRHIGSPPPARGIGGGHRRAAGRERRTREAGEPRVFRPPRSAHRGGQSLPVARGAPTDARRPGPSGRLRVAHLPRSRRLQAGE